MNNDNHSQTKIQAPISQGLQVLVKQLFSLYRQWDYNEVTFTENPIDIGELFIHLGFDPIEVKLWLSGHKLLFTLDTPVISSDFQDLTPKGLITLWEKMIDELQDGLLRLGMKIDDQTAIDWLEKIEQFCKDETELLKIGQRIKKMLINHSGWQNLIKPFERNLSRRIWDEREKGKQAPIDPSNERLRAEELKIQVKAYLQEKDPAMRVVLKERFVKQGISNSAFNELTKVLGNQTTTLRAKPLSASDFRNCVSGGSKWLIPGLIGATGVTLLTAPPGGSKSTFAFDLAGSIINGTDFMGEPIKENGFVVFACSDEPLAESQERATLQGFINSDNFAFLTDWTVQQMEMLEESIADNRPKLVIVDSLDSINSGAGIDENSTEASNCIKQFTALSNKYSCAFVLLHHENKDPQLKGVNKARGSTAIVASANGHIRIMGGAEGDNEQPDDSGTVSKIVKIEKLRGGETRSIQCNVDYYNVKFEPVVDLEFEQSKDKRQTILNFLQKPANRNKFFEASELNRYLGWEGKGIYRYLKQLGDRGEISRKPNQMGRKGMVYGFFEPELTVEESLEQLAKINDLDPVSQPEAPIAIENDLAIKEPEPQPDIQIGQTVFYNHTQGKLKATVKRIMGQLVELEPFAQVAISDLILE